jgi:hypothetical protein
MLNLPLNFSIVRRMRAARGVIEEERLVRIERVQLIEIGDGLIGHVGGEVVVGIADVGVDAGGVAVEIGLPLIGLAAIEAVEIFKAHARGPLVEGAGLARHVRRRVVILPYQDVA